MINECSITISLCIVCAYCNFTFCSIRIHGRGSITVKKKKKKITSPKKCINHRVKRYSAGIFFRYDKLIPLPNKSRLSGANINGNLATRSDIKCPYVRRRDSEPVRVWFITFRYYCVQRTTRSNYWLHLH